MESKAVFFSMAHVNLKGASRNFETLNWLEMIEWFH